GHQAELPVAAPQLVEEGRCDSRSCGAEGMSDRDRSTHDVELCPVHLADRLRESRALGPPFRLETLEVRQYLCGKRFVHLHEIHVLQRAPGPLERDGRGQM